MKNNKKYLVLNVVCLVTAFLSFSFLFTRIFKFNLLPDFKSFSFLIVTALLVYGLKMLRLYMILSGNTIPFHNHMRLFCKTALISILFPFKLGELFRAYCYGHFLHYYAKGILAIVLDRFTDTLGLITILIFVSFTQALSFGFILHILCIFLLITVISYYIFPELYIYWNGYFMKIPATPNRIRFLSLLYYLRKLYLDCQTLIQGRVILLYLLSLFAWTIEILGVALAVMTVNYELNPLFFAEYLKSALGIGHSIFQYWFILSSCLVLAVGILITYSFKFFEGRGKA